MWPFLWTAAVAGSQIQGQQRREKPAPSSPLSCRLQSPVNRSVMGEASDLSHTVLGQWASCHSCALLGLSWGFSHTFVFCSKTQELLTVLEIWGQENQQTLQTGQQHWFTHPDNWTDPRQTMFGKGRAAGNQLCSAAGDVMSLESKMGRELRWYSLCHKNWGWRIFTQTWEKAEQREEGTSRRGGGGAENRQGNSSFWERGERILQWGKLSPVIFVQI